jgi:hypothetical protein
MTARFKGLQKNEKKKTKVKEEMEKEEENCHLLITTPLNEGAVKISFFVDTVFIICTCHN